MRLAEARRREIVRHPGSFSVAEITREVIRAIECSCYD
jgi:hypothetical protein